MSLTALLLVLAAAVCHAAWNIIAHRASGSGVPFLWWGSLVSALIWLWVIPLTGWTGDATAPSMLLGVLVSAVLHVGYMVVLQRGYTQGDLSTVYATARGTGPVLTVLMAVLFLGERPSGWALSGGALIVLGVIGFGIIGRQQRPRGRLDPALVYGLLTGGAIACYTVWDAFAVTELGIAPVAFMVGCAFAEVPFFTVALLRRDGPKTAFTRLAAEWRATWKRLLAFGVLSPLSYILVLTAITMAPVALVAPMREVSVVLVGLYGAWRYRESHPVLRIAAALVVVVGVVLIGV